MQPVPPDITMKEFSPTLEARMGAELLLSGSGGGWFCVGRSKTEELALGASGCSRASKEIETTGVFSMICATLRVRDKLQ